MIWAKRKKTSHTYYYASPQIYIVGMCVHSLPLLWPKNVPNEKDNNHSTTILYTPLTSRFHPFSTLEESVKHVRVRGYEETPCLTWRPRRCDRTRYRSWGTPWGTKKLFKRQGSGRRVSRYIYTCPKVASANKTASRGAFKAMNGLRRGRVICGWI